MNNRQKTYRLYKAERLAVRPRRRRRLPERERLRLVVPQPRNQRWSMDFASDIVKNPAPLSRCIRITRKPLTPSVGSVEGRDAEPLVWRLLPWTLRLRARLPDRPCRPFLRATPLPGTGPFRSLFCGSQGTCIGVKSSCFSMGLNGAPERIRTPNPQIRSPRPALAPDTWRPLVPLTNL